MSTIGVVMSTIAGEHAVCRSRVAGRHQLRVVRAGDGQDVARGMFLAVLPDAHRGVRRIATNHKDCGAAASLDQHLSGLTLHGLEGAWHTPLTMQSTQCYAEHRDIHLGSLLRAEAHGQYLDEAHAGCAMYRFAYGGTRDKGGHAVVDQTGHHVSGVVR
jgi:hypothetical protein